MRQQTLRGEELVFALFCDDIRRFYSFFFDRSVKREIIRHNVRVFLARRHGNKHAMHVVNHNGGVMDLTNHDVNRLRGTL